MKALPWWEFALLCAFLLVYLLSQAYVGQDQLYVDLARAFLSGELSFLVEDQTFTDARDVVLYGSKYYWPSGPLPSVLLMPFVLVFKNPPQFIFRGLLNVANLILVYMLVRRVWDKSTRTLALWFALGFVAGTAYWVNSLLPMDVLIAQIAGVTLLLLALIEYFGKRRWWLLGLGVVALGLTRPTMWLSVFLFLSLWCKDQEKGNIKWKELWQFLVPIGIGVIIFFMYNYARFGSIIETGYRFQAIDSGRQRLQEYGLFHLKYLPANLYSLLLATPRLITNVGDKHAIFPYLTYSPWGMSIVFAAPVLLLSLRNLRRRGLWPFWLSALILLLPNLIYYGIGYYQYGYRYALDIYPILLVLAVYKLPLEKARLAKGLIVFGVLFTFWVGFVGS